MIASQLQNCRGLCGWRPCTHVYRDFAEILVSEVVGYLKGKSAVARQSGGRQKNFSGERFWPRVYVISTVGFELDKI